MVTLGACLFLWWVLTEGDPGSWTLGVPLAVLAALSVFTLPAGRRYRIAWRQVLPFALSFFWQSLVGGLDVSRRAFSPRLPLRPGFIDYPVQLRRGPALTFFMIVISLLPGTLSVGLHRACVHVHVLDLGLDVQGSLADLEGRVARLFGITIHQGEAS
nr:Na+/H+ antiporter subunit E [Ectothiorhodospira variabilis]